MPGVSVWHYVQNGQACGPVELSALQALIASGALSADALVWKPGMTDWLPARTVAELADSVPPNAPPPPIATPPPGAATDEAADIAQNKVLAVIAYLGPLLIVSILAAPHSRFARFHSNQALVLFLAFFIIYCALFLFSLIPFFICLLAPFHFAAWFGLLFLMILGVINAAGGQYKELPWVGHYRLLS